MSQLVNVAIHPSQFPENVRRDLLESLRHRQVSHKFHYDSVKQTAKWLALHQAYSPSRTDLDCAQTYDRAFEQTARLLGAGAVDVVGLGCGGGQKDTRLLEQLRLSGKQVRYLPCDVSLAMVLEARRTASNAIPNLDCLPLVCDLNHTQDLAAAVDQRLGLGDQEQDPAHKPVPNSPRLFTLFGMLPNFESGVILPQLADVVRPHDFLLLSANLAPGNDYIAGINRVLPLYDNPMTRDWLTTFVLDLGVEPGDGEIRFQIEEDPNHRGWRRIAAYFQFRGARSIRLDNEVFEFHAGEVIRLFFSNRHTSTLVRSALGECGLEMAGEWVTRSEEEGVFLVAGRPNAAGLGL